LNGYRTSRRFNLASREIAYALFGPTADGRSTDDALGPRPQTVEPVPVSNQSIDLARCFLRLANLPNYAIDRLSRYEATLWRQVSQILFALDSLDRRKPQERRRRLIVGGGQEPRDEHDEY
jgi:hypothetical protein